MYSRAAPDWMLWTTSSVAVITAFGAVCTLILHTFKAGPSLAASSRRFPRSAFNTWPVVFAVPASFDAPSAGRLPCKGIATSGGGAICDPVKMNEEIAIITIVVVVAVAFLGWLEIIGRWKGRP